MSKKKEKNMGSFNEIQKGTPDLGSTYWQDLKKTETAENKVEDIVKMNCQTIFNSEDSNIHSKNNPSIFKK